MIELTMNNTSDSKKNLVNLNELDLLAKLMATENIVVEHRQVMTASFDTERRILTLPMWKNLTRNIYHLLVTHEIGHALETPADEWKSALEENIQFKPFLNVIEDAREERKTKLRYPGSRRDFRNGYFELYQQDFFKIQDRDIDKFSFIDRINLHYKIGESVKVSFTDDEMKYIHRIDKLITFKDGLDLTKELYALAKKNEEKKQDRKKHDDQDEDEGEEFETDENMGDDVEEYEYEDYDVSELEAETVEAFENSIQDNFIDSISRPSQYIDLDMEFDWKDYVIDYQTVIDSSKLAYMNDTDNLSHLDKYSLNGNQYKKLRYKSIKMIDYMVKEFEMRKAAFTYVRNRESKCGIINTNKLYAYKMIDDIFKRNIISPESKNHGIIMYVDFSASMRQSLRATIDQLFNLVMFCRKVKIPHRVYGFTTRQTIDERSAKLKSDACDRAQKKNRILYTAAGSNIRLIELFSEKMSLISFRNMIEILMNISDPYLKRSEYLVLGNTPLDSCAILARNMLEEFKKQTKLQIVSVVFLTDGDNNCKPFVTPNPDEIVIPSSGNNFFLCDVKTKKMHKVHSAQKMTSILMKILREDGYHVIAFRIDSRSKIFKMIKDSKLYDQIAIDNFSKIMRKEKCITLTNFYGTEEYHMINDGSFDSDENFSMDVRVGSSKNEIKRAFIKARSSRINTRSILKNFAKRVAI